MYSSYGSVCTKKSARGQIFWLASDEFLDALLKSANSDLRLALICTTPRPRATRKRVDRAHTQIAMLLKSLLFAMLLSDAAGGCGLGTPPHACKPRLRGTAQRNSSDVNETTSPDDVIERAAVSNQFNPGPRPRECHDSRTLVVTRRVSSDEPTRIPIPTTRARVPSPQALIVKMPQAVHAIWPILLLRSPHGPRMLQVD